jgi:tRNA (cytidine/uridine-2'-O-)-methyltransferase
MFAQPDPTGRHPERHVVLVAPEIHWNTGNIGRTCLAARARLHLVRPLGFSLASREVKRAGLDYWGEVKPTVWESFDDWAEALRPAEGEIAILTKTGSRPFWSMPRVHRLCLVFGSETRGLPADLLERYAGEAYHIPTTDRTRSLNLSTAAGIALYESLREAPDFHAWGQKR